MQFFKGLLKIPELYYRDKDAVQTTAKTLNTKYWLHENGSRYHILASEVTVNRITFITMYEGGEISIDDVRENCEMFIEELCSAHGSQHLDAYSNQMKITEITLDSFCNLFSEDLLNKMYDDKSAIMGILHIDNTKFVCKEELLEPFSNYKQFTRRYLDNRELMRIRNGRVRSDSIVFQPVHYIVLENNAEIIKQIDDELIYELRKAKRIVSRRCIHLSEDDVFKIQKYGHRIQNLNNLDGGIVFVDVSSDSVNDLVRTVYSETNHYRGRYAVVFHVNEDDEKSVEEIEKTCRLWPFFIICNKRLGRRDAIRQLLEVAKSNDIDISRKDCQEILKANGIKNEYTFDEINDMFRRWMLTVYNIEVYHPQYREMIEQYYSSDAGNADGLKELDELIGLRDVKELCRKIISFYEVQKIRRVFSDEIENIGMHMVFTGNPGTAKTTVARLMARILKQKGILYRGEMIEVGRADLVGKYVGWTAKTVKDYFHKAKGNVLFIDEAYSLVDDNKSFGTEAINTIVQEMENCRNDVVVIFAGYKKEMAEFIKANSGLESRISFFVDFPDYSGDELFGILKYLAKKDNYVLGDDVYEKFMANMEMRNTQNGNGRLVRNEFEKAKLRQAQRIMGMAKKRRKEALFTLVGQDFGGEAI